MVGTGTRKARAISSVVRPPRTRSVSATRASCASASAAPMSPTRRASPAMSRADSIRQIASVARCASAFAASRRPGLSDVCPARRPMARGPSHALVFEDLTDLEGPAVIRCPFEPLEGLIHRAHLPQPVPGHKLLGLRERPVDDGALLAVETDTLALRARVEPAGLEHHARFDQLVVELLILRHRLRRWGSRRRALLAFLRHDQHTHLCLLLLQLPHRDGLGLCRLTHSSNDRWPFRHVLTARKCWLRSLWATA